MTLKNGTNLFLLICLCSISTNILAQTQLGADIDGEAAGDRFGFSISLSSDGNRMAVGGIWNDETATDAGHVRAYEWSGTEWLQLGSDIEGEAAHDQNGRSVSLSSDGNRLAIGAHRHSGNGYRSGYVRVFRWTGSDWVQFGEDINGEAAEDASGYSISLSSEGDRLAIGATGNDAGGDVAGQVRVYQWSGSEWVQLGSDIDGEAAGDRSGAAVSLSSNGSRVAIGAPLNGNQILQSSLMGTSSDRPGKISVNQEKSGHVRVYHWTGEAWVQLGSDIDGQAVDEDFGTSVSLSTDGMYLAAGGPDINAGRAGVVRVYRWTGSTWVQLGADIDGEAEIDAAGYSVSLSGNGMRLAIGALGNDENGDLSGQARVYQWSGLAWLQLGADIDGEATGDFFGTVSLSSDGNRLGVGGEANDGNGTDSGHVRVYDLSMFNTFNINPGLNDAWYNPLTDGQGFFITVFPDLGYLSLAWFTYDTDLPPVDATSNLGDPGHRWITAVGPYLENKATLNIEMTSGGLFDTTSEITRTDPPGTDGTITVIFDDCDSGSVEYDIPSINRTGVVPIERVANDNAVLCQVLGEGL